VRRGAILAAGLLLALTAAAGPADAQVDPRSRPREPMIHPDIANEAHAMLALRRRLIELDRLLALGSVGRAAGLLDELSQHSELQRELATRRITLAQLQGDHAQAVDLCRKALRDQQRDPGLWRELTVSLLAVDRPDSARLALDRFLTYSPNARSGAIVGVELFRRDDRPRIAVALIDSLRTVFAEPRFLGIERLLALLAAGRQEDAAAETAAELRANPFNLSLLRSELLDGPYQPGRHDAYLQAVGKAAAEVGAGTAEQVLLANLLLAGGDARAAAAAVRPVSGRLSGAMQVLQNAVILLREFELQSGTEDSGATVEYLVAVLEHLTEPGGPESGTRRRAADLLAETCEQALARDVLAADPARSVERFTGLLDRVRRINPASQQLYAAQIRLAAYRRDRLQDPAAAARTLETMLLDLDLPTEGVAIVRLTLGECYLAAGDTARGRTVLTSLGRDRDFRQASGHAHYHLARLDLAEGHYATARDRFAVVALDNAAAPYANDALELGLAVAEELDNPTGGPDILDLYARAVYADLTADPAGRLAALQDFVAEASRRLDPDAPQHLLERGRFELGEALAAAGRIDEALAAWADIVGQQPDGRYAAEALRRSGEVLMDAGRADAARRSWERLLAQYPDYLFIDDVREALRGLPN